MKLLSLKLAKDDRGRFSLENKKPRVKGTAKPVALSANVSIKAFIKALPAYMNYRWDGERVTRKGDYVRDAGGRFRPRYASVKVEGRHVTVVLVNVAGWIIDFKSAARKTKTRLSIELKKE